jgi:hypothetical protein
MGGKRREKIFGLFKCNLIVPQTQISERRREGNEDNINKKKILINFCSNCDPSV